jgi:hypothetical protein
MTRELIREEEEGERRRRKFTVRFFSDETPINFVSIFRDKSNNPSVSVSPWKLFSCKFLIRFIERFK